MFDQRLDQEFAKKQNDFFHARLDLRTKKVAGESGCQPLVRLSLRRV